MSADNDTATNATLRELTSRIVCAYLTNNAIVTGQIPGLIKTVATSLSEAGSISNQPISVSDPEPAVPVKRSVFPDYIVCLEDGKKLKMLKRHLRTSFGLSTQQYREKWGLPADYPFVAPNYSKRRSSIARDVGLGNKRTVEMPIAPVRGRRAVAAQSA